MTNNEFTMSPAIASEEIRVAVVEDERIIALEIKRTLERLGYIPVGLCATGQEAIALIEAENPDIVLLDIRLAGKMDGVAVAMHIREHHSIPFIFMTANADEETIQRAKLTSPFGYLVKPISFRELHTAIQMALHKHQSEVLVAHSEKKYRRIFENSNDGLLILDADGDVLDCNSGACRILGYDRSQLTGKKLTALHPEAMRQDFEKTLAELVQTGVVRYETSLLHESGSVTEVEVTGSAFDEIKKQSVLVIRDLSEERKVERGVRSISHETAGLSGQPFFESLVSNLARTLDVGIAFIAECDTSDSNSVQTRAYFRGGQIVENEEYGLSQTPCEMVLQKDYFIQKSGVQHAFPKAMLLDRHNIDGYAGIALHGSDDQVLGFIVIMDSKPLKHTMVIRSTLQLFALRAASELVRLQYEETLRSREERYRVLFNSGNDAVFVYQLDDHGNPSQLKEVNDVACKWLGYTRGELQTFRPWDLLRLDGKDTSVPIPQKAYPLFECRLQAKDGETIPVEVNINHFKLGQSRTVLAVARDLTQRKAVEAALAQEKQLSAHLLQHSPALIYIKDTESRYILVNPAFLKFVGKTKDEVLGKAAQDFFSDAHVQAVSHSESIIREQKTQLLQQEEFVTDWQGREHWLLSTKMPFFDDEDNFQGIIGISQDITERVASEKEMKRAMLAAEAANKAKSEFLANISHELRTPMNGIIGLTDLALDSVEDPEIHHYLEMVSQSADSLLSILNDLLDFAKIEAGKVELDESRFDLSALVSDLYMIQLMAAQEKGLSLELDFDPALKGQYVGDMERLKQVLINLIGNAIKFTEKGRVSIRIRPLTERDGLDSIQRLPHYHYCHFVVEDTGIGIPSEHLEDIFESFKQVDGSLTRKYGGTGLGLAICRQLVTMMGGDIWATSQENSGSAFSFYLPFKEAQSEIKSDMLLSPVRKKISEFSGFDASILVVEDEPVNREVVVRFLQKWGCLVETADDGRQALELMAKSAYDLIIMDVQMPVMDGLEATRIIRSGDAPGIDVEVPIVALTAHALEKDRRKCLAVGMNDYISKPIDSSVFFQVIKRHLKAGEEVSLPDSVDPSAEAESRQVIDQNAVLNRLDGDTELFIKTMTVFADHVPRRMEELGAAVKHKDRDETGHLAHSLKSAAANIGASRLSELAADLDAASEEQHWKAIKTILSEIENEYNLVMSVLPDLTQQQVETMEDASCQQ